MNKPEYVKVNNTLYKINTDFRVAIECNKICRDKTIPDFERALAIIYKLFGEDGLNCENQNKLCELAMKYIMLGREQNNLKSDSQKNYELDINKCEGIIASSFVFDYGYNPYNLKYLHWYDFYNDLENLSSSEFGNCCILNRITNVLETNEREVKDEKTRKKIVEAKKELKKKYCIQEEKELTKEQEESARRLYESLGIKF